MHFFLLKINSFTSSQSVKLLILQLKSNYCTLINKKVIGKLLNFRLLFAKFLQNFLQRLHHLFLSLHKTVYTTRFGL